MRKDKELLQDILDALNSIENFSKGKSKKEFFKSDLLQSAVIRKLEIIGEATKKLSKDLKKKHMNIPWRDIAGMRDILIHEYFSVYLERVWEVTQKDIPELKKQIANILKEIKIG